MVILGIIALLLLIGCIGLALLWNDAEKQCCDLRIDLDDARRARQRQSEDFSERIRELNQEFAEVQKQRDWHIDFAEKAKADADAETAHCRTLEAQVTTIGQELQDAHERINDLVGRLEQIRTACDHPYHLPVMEEK